MCSMSVLCPLCAQTSFSSIDALRCSLIKAANGPLACPICHELFLGLDKLTIHLFSHTNIMNSTNNIEIGASSSSLPSSSSAIQNNKYNNENLNTKEIENPINMKNSKINNAENDMQQNTTEVNFENIHHPERNIAKKTKAIKTEKKKINKSNSTQPQVVAINELPQLTSQKDELKEIDNLATCDICEFTFRNEELRDMHVRLVHQNFVYNHVNLTNTCPNNTSASLTNNSGNLTQNSPQEHDFKCHLCSKTFKMKGSLRVHLKVVHLMGLPYVNNTPKLSICDRIRHRENKILKSAGVNNNSTTNLTNHQAPAEALSSLTTNHNNSLFNIQPVNFISTLNANPNLSVVNILNPPEFQQNTIENAHHNHATTLNSNVLLLFNHSTGEIVQHVNPTLDNEITSKLNTNSINSSSQTSSLLPTTSSSSSSAAATSLSAITENPKIWECDVCSKAFTTKYFLKKHKRLHTGEMPYTCELCARTFTFQQSYHKHLLYHSDEKPHVCSTCGRAFKELSTLHNHERIHSGEKPFKCEVCGKSFRQRVSFLVHTRIHTGVMPYKCDICQKSFRYKVSQRTHKCQPLSAEQSPTHETIDNISENFIKAFLETSTHNNSGGQHSPSHLNQSQNSPASNEIAAINDQKSPSLDEQQALLNKTIDDIVVESCNKMGIGSDGFTPVQNINEGSMSPSQKLQNMRLYSPQLVTPDLNGIDGDLTRFFLENSQSGNNLL